MGWRKTSIFTLEGKARLSGRVVWSWSTAGWWPEINWVVGEGRMLQDRCREKTRREILEVLDQVVRDNKNGFSFPHLCFCFVPKTWIWVNPPPMGTYSVNWSGKEDKWKEWRSRMESCIEHNSGSLSGPHHNRLQGHLGCCFLNQESACLKKEIRLMDTCCGFCRGQRYVSGGRPRVRKHDMSWLSVSC